MKAVRNNNAKPALFTPSSFDIYFREDIRELHEESILANEVIMERTAYANGTGTLSGWILGTCASTRYSLKWIGY
jgi:hypothetical protein